MKLSLWMCWCALAASACGKTTSDSSAGGAAAPGAGSAGSAGAGPWAKRPTADCPAYPGKAAVALADVDGGYTATITTDDASAVATIRAHAAYVVGASRAGAGADALRFGGATGDRTRNCPVILDGTTITSEEVDQGVRLTVIAQDAAAAPTLRADAKDRAELLAVMRDAMK